MRFGFKSFIVAALLVAACDRSEPQRLTTRQFVEAVHTISIGWNQGNARMAADVFAEDAVYEEPPKKQFYKGRAQLFEFFGGAKGPERPMHMTWHNLAFNEAAQVGFGEYTFAMNNQYHGIVVMQFENGKIVRWREYQYRSPQDWKAFAGDSGFETAN